MAPVVLPRRFRQVIDWGERMGGGKAHHITRDVVGTSVAMALEYEAICMLADHRLAAGATENDVRNLLDAIFDVIVPGEIHYQWRPQLNDASDEMVPEAAVNGRADAIVTLNHGDYRGAPARFGIQFLRPSEALGKIRTDLHI